MTTHHPLTNTPFPPDSIQRILYICASAHVYAVPPLTSKGYIAQQWQEIPQMPEARIRVFESTMPSSPSPSPSSSTSTSTSTFTSTSTTSTTTPTSPSAASTGSEPVQTFILLESARTGELLAAAPYTHPSVVQHCTDSSRYFAIRVQDGASGRKATLGIGFEERSDAFDFGVALQDAGKVLGFEQKAAGGPGRPAAAAAAKTEEKRDYSLKEGETITVNIGGKGRRSKGGGAGTVDDEELQRVSAFLPPPPTSADVRRRNEGDEAVPPAGQTAQEMGFDDGEFGEFQ